MRNHTLPDTERLLHSVGLSLNNKLKEHTSNKNIFKQAAVVVFNNL